MRERFEGAIPADLAILTGLALAGRLAAALLVDWAPYTDPAYYTLVAARLAEGQGFTVPVLWSFLEVGGQLPADPRLPVPSNGHWMPLTSVVVAGSMLLFGADYRGGQIAMVALSTLLVPITYLIGIRFWRSRRIAILAALLGIFAGPLLLMYPTIDNFAVFGLVGVGVIWTSCEAVGERRPIGWLAGSGALVGLATLARVDGLLLAVAPFSAWVLILRRERTLAVDRLLLLGVTSFGAFVVIVGPWALRNLAEFGSMLPSAGGHTLWITDYNEQFTIGREPSVQSYLAWGIVPIVLSKLLAWGELLGRTAVLMGGVFLFGLIAGLWSDRRRELRPFRAYIIAMFVVMGLVFTFHAPKGAFYHSAPAWLPFAFPMAVAGLATASTAPGRFWRFLRRPATHRFLEVAGLAGAIVLSLAGSAVLYEQWTVGREREEAAARFLSRPERRNDVILYSDPASMWLRTGNPGVAGPFDGYDMQEAVIRAYEVEWVVVVLGPGAEIDPLGLWGGARARDADGRPASFLDDQPSFEAPGVRIYRVIDS